MPKTAEELAQTKRRVQEERKAKRAAARAAKPAEIPDEKTKEDYERRIKGLQTQLRNERAKVKAIAKVNAAFFESAQDRRVALALFHTDRFKPDKRDQAKRVFQLLNNIPVIDR